MQTNAKKKQNIIIYYIHMRTNVRPVTLVVLACSTNLTVILTISCQYQLIKSPVYMHVVANNNRRLTERSAYGLQCQFVQTVDVL